MGTYIARRLLLTIPTILLVTALTTAAMRFVPGDAVDQLIYRMDSSANLDIDALRAELKAQLGLDVPPYVQYARWWRDLILHGDLGMSIFGGIPVTDQILQRFPVTVRNCRIGHDSSIGDLLSRWHIFSSSARYLQRLLIPEVSPYCSSVSPRSGWESS